MILFSNLKDPACFASWGDQSLGISFENLTNYRLNGFPHGLGKGHDAAVVGAWLANEVRHVVPESVADWLKSECFIIYVLWFSGWIFWGAFGNKTLKPNRLAAAKDPKYWDILAIIQRTCVASDRFWRTIYQNGLWIPKTVAMQIVSDGWSFTVSCSIPLVSSSVFHFTPWKYVWDPPF